MLEDLPKEMSFLQPGQPAPVGPQPRRLFVIKVQFHASSTSVPAVRGCCSGSVNSTPSIGNATYSSTRCYYSLPSSVLSTDIVILHSTSTNPKTAVVGLEHHLAAVQQCLQSTEFPCTDSAQLLVLLQYFDVDCVAWCCRFHPMKLIVLFGIKPVRCCLSRTRNNCARAGLPLRCRRSTT